MLRHLVLVEDDGPACGVCESESEQDGEHVAALDSESGGVLSSAARGICQRESRATSRQEKETDLRDGEGMEADDGEEERVARVGGLCGGLFDDALPLRERTQVVTDLRVVWRAVSLAA